MDNNIYFLAGTDNRRDMNMGGQDGANNDGGLDSYPSALDPGCKPSHFPPNHLGSFSSHLGVAISCADHDDPWVLLGTRVEDTPLSAPSMLSTFPSATNAWPQHGIAH